MIETIKRIEIIANLSVEEDIIDHFDVLGHGESFTYLHPVFGRGKSGRREGSPVWPETNTLFIAYLDDDSAMKMVDHVAELKQRFPSEGIRCWLSDAYMKEQ